ncbi:outer membrane protein with beta-barrel domain [Hydrogenivirga caldilitoris]|uniref:Outer membrane protein with beta-barrel domain n=1 Tax=Hydrogenivirga caldilitoris TaxID=246264 RepID=A0A497XQH5_9AQUI|nr:outer membrane beta-barrel protein [Hydrogenivirga caldilitoris]RLJ71227.1 outer membrane protein with beta-barrel domain [Hydrogenivirga caldilitoris]
MKKLLLTLPLMASIGFAQYFEGDVVREFGVKTGLVKVKYDSVDGSKPDKTLEEFLSAYGYMGARTTAGFNAGASIELSTGSKMTRSRTVIYTSLELNPSVELNLSHNLRAYTGFGGSINRLKERAGSLTNEDSNLGLQFFVGAKYNIFPTFGILGEYKGKIFMTGDYDGNVVHHFNLGVFFLIY